MKISRSYMKGQEFKSRQAWLPFVDAVGIVLEVLSPGLTGLREWFREWKKAFITKAPQTMGGFQLDLFGIALQPTI